MFETKDKIYPDVIPNGCRKEMTVHFSLEGGGQGFYKIKTIAGEYLPISYQYDTRKEGPKCDPLPTGFFIDGIEACFTSWKEVREFWPSFIEDRKKEPVPV